MYLLVLVGGSLVSKMQTSGILGIPIRRGEINGHGEIEIQSAVNVLEKAEPLSHGRFQKRESATVFILRALFLLFASVDDVESGDGGVGRLKTRYLS